MSLGAGNAEALWRPFQEALAHSGITVSSHHPSPLYMEKPDQLLVDSELTLTGVAIPLRVWQENDGLLLHYTEIGLFHISHGGSRIRFRFAPSCGNYADEIIERALSTVISIALQERGALCMHASSVVIHGCAVAFLGLPGAGKSTLAAACLAGGAELAADDITPIVFDHGERFVLPFGPSVKLLSDIAGDWLNAEGLHQTYSTSFEKHIVAVGQLHARQHNSAAPLHGLFSLQRAEQGLPSDTYIEELSGHQLGSILLSNSYLASWIPTLGLEQPWLGQISALAKTVPVSILHYGSGREALAEAQAAIFQFVERTSPA